jgi:pimeloyl-ACP methyl ester carboxylesterase
MGLFAKNRFDEITAQAKEMVAAGRGRDLMLLPDWWWVISADSFLDRSENTPDILAEAPNVAAPTLFFRGDKEPREIYPAEDYAARSKAPCEVRIVPDCDHFYRGHESEVAEEIAVWLKKTCGLG